MTKRNILLANLGILTISTLYAFSYPEIVRDQVLTLFFPDRNPSVAVVNNGLTLQNAAAPRDTNPPFQERFDDFLNGANTNPIDLQDPKAIDKEVEYDPSTNMYIITERIGDDFYRAPTYMTFEEYVRYRDNKQQQEYFDRLQGVASAGDRSSSGVVDPIARFDVKTSLVDRLFGGTNVDIRPSGNINLTFGFDYQKIENPILTLRQQQTGNFDFDMDINMNASGKIGEKLTLNFNYNTQATFDFDNQMKIQYDTKNFSEDEIIQNIEAGNVSMPLRSNLIKGAQNLFGLKTEMKFGHLRSTIVVSQQRSKQQQLTVQGGSQVQVYEKPIDEYDENRHFFMSHWNREDFEPAMKCLPVPQSLFNITRIEVWITNDRLATENVRDIVPIADLGEAEKTKNQWKLNSPPYLDVNNKPLPDNSNNSLYPTIRSELNNDSTFRFSDQVVRRLTDPMGEFNIQQITDFEKVRARLLNASEFTYHEQLGFVSINLNVQPDQVVGLAMEYTYNGVPHKVGEFTSEVPNGDSLNQNVLFVKMLKSTTANVQLPIWDLMMKNVYAVGSANVDPQEFRFDVFYEDPGKGQKRFLDADNVPSALRAKPLLQVFGLDNLNLQADPGADGIFDFVPGLTINLRSGRIMFPVLEPFGSSLLRKFEEADPGVDSAQLAETLIYTQLYDSTLFRAREYQQLNRFTLKGSYKSSTSSEISLGTFNLPKGSVRVSAGGRQLTEGVDYQIDYNIGKVKILNDAILQSGQNVSISFEDNTLFGFQARTMFGARFDYALDKDINIGATYMNLFERPLTQKVNFGDDPINNRMYGFDFNLSKDAPWLTRIVDKIPLIDTKEPSSITAQAEVAFLNPGYNKAINQGQDEGGTVFIDDFEGSTSNLLLSNPANVWFIASVPQGDLSLFPESAFTDTLALGVNRGNLSWYVADPSARDGVDAEDPYTRLFNYQDIFPNRQLTPLEQNILRPLDVTFYPRDRGPYNFELPDGYPGISQGLTTSGELNEPSTRWGGFMRGLNTNDFEAANIEFIEFWMLNPYMEKIDGTGVSKDGDMYIDLGTISEDIMRDSRQFFENAIPTSTGSGATVNTKLGRVPVLPPVVNAFDNDPAKRALQDVGLDGLNDEGERNFYTEWMNAIMASTLSPKAKAAFEQDPSNDNFVYFNDPAFENNQPGMLARYRRFNNQQGNSPTNETSNLNPSSTTLPDIEDLNRDNSLNENEAYFRYKLHLHKTMQGNQEVLDLSNPAVANIVTDTVMFDRDGKTYIWYRFKVPLDHAGRTKVGAIQDFRSIRFIRMFWKDFDERTTFRFATLELGRNQWRRFTQPLAECDVPKNPIPFDVNAVSIEENSARTPFNYVIPFGVQREQSVGAFPDVLQNEQSMAVSICSLNYCDARGVFKTLNMDLRQFDRIKMYVHAEAQEPLVSPLDSQDLTVFIRLGSDFYNNYYEYEIPLYPSDPNLLNGVPESREYKDEVWKPENQFDIPLDLLTEVKKLRNADPDWPFSTPYVVNDPGKPGSRVKVVGNPNLGYVKGIMMGVRNVDTIDFDNHCVEVWFNELRLNGFSEKGGFAGLARVDMKLADLGNIAIAGNYSGIGWGSIEERLIQRQLEEIYQYDISTNLELGKFLPEKTGIRIPFYIQYSNITRLPKYDPYDLDIVLKEKIQEADVTDRDSIRNQAQDVTIVRGYNFTNVRKERRGNSKPMPWDIENFSLTYAFNQQKKRNPFIISDQLNQYKGAIDYQYSTGMKPLEPFKNAKLNDTYFKWIKDFNFNPIPNTYGFGTSVDRVVQTTVWRFAGEDPKLNTYYNRRFLWDRNFDLGWDMARSLRFNFDANSRNVIDEPLQFNTDGTEVSKEERKDSIWQNIRMLGRPKNYMHNATLNWTLPFRSLPYMDWVSMKASYSAGYSWTAQSLKLQNLGSVYDNENSRNLGHIIQNNNLRQINGDFNFEGLYNKNKYLAKINKPKSKVPGTSGGAPGDKNAPGGRGRKPGLPAEGEMGATPDKKSDPKKNNSTVPGVIPNPSASKTDSLAAAADGGKKDKKKEKDPNRQPSTGERIALRPLMLLRKARFTYSENYTTVVPGFTPETKLLGLSEGFEAPGWAFVAGIQPKVSWLDEAGENGWITYRPELNQQVMRNYTQTFDAGATLEPFNEFRIELNSAKQFTKNNTELFKDQNPSLDPNDVLFEHRAQRDLGSYTVTFFSLNTLFNNDINGLFKRFENNRLVVSNRLGVDAGNTDPHTEDGPQYKFGYGKIQQEVLLPSFVAAYTEKDANSVGLDVFKINPSVNWKLNYNGLSKVGNLSKIFSSIQISHGYKSTLTVSSYNTDIFYDPEQPNTIDSLNFNYVARYEIPQVIVNEQMAPLLGIDVKLRNDMTFRVDFKKSRTLAMSFIDYQLAETRSSGYLVGFGYRMRNVNIPFLTNSKTKKTSSKKKKTDTAPGPGGRPAGGNAQQANDMNFKFDFELRDDITVNHRLDQLDEAVPTRGARTVSINPSIDYAINRRLTLRLFTDYRRTVPKTSQAFPITTLNAGVTVQFKLN